MLQLTKDDRDVLAAVRQSWLFLAIMASLISSQVFVESWFGLGWGIVAAVSELFILLIIRPWRFAAVSVEMRRTMRRFSLVVFAAFAFFSLLIYLRR